MDSAKELCYQRKRVWIFIDVLKKTLVLQGNQKEQCLRPLVEQTVKYQYLKRSADPVR